MKERIKSFFDMLWKNTEQDIDIFKDHPVKTFERARELLKRVNYRGNSKKAFMAKSQEELLNEVSLAIGYQKSQIKYTLASLPELYELYRFFKDSKNFKNKE